jgi:hypothetical protein
MQRNKCIKLCLHSKQISFNRKVAKEERKERKERGIIILNFASFAKALRLCGYDFLHIVRRYQMQRNKCINLC